MKEIYQAYYTNSDIITDYMISRLELKSSDTILEPSVGEGVFIDKILDFFPDIDITTYDIDQYSKKVMDQKYKNKKNVKSYESDTLLDIDLDFREMVDDGFDKIIGNPPYGSKFSSKVKEIISKKYSNIYSKESYVLFLYRCLSLLREKGKLVFIIPDTFLFLNSHKKFRKILLENYVVEEIAIFPSKWFPGISFGYSNLSIITIKREQESIEKNIIKVFDCLQNKTDLLELTSKNCKYLPKLIQQKNVLLNMNCSFHFNIDIEKSITDHKVKLGDIADCVTGLYTGNNQKFLKVKDENVRNSKNYTVIKNNEIEFDHASIKGLNDKKYIPIIKGAIRIAYQQPGDEWFVKWDQETINFYNSDKKARFQNSSFYFKTGIAVPMLKSKRIKASIMKNRVFDQSIVGIFPKNNDDLYYILALLNSSIVNEIIHNINPSVNNSANYLKRIPIPEVSKDQKKVIDSLVIEMIKGHKNNSEKIEEIISRLYKL